MSFVVIGYPKIAKSDFEWIQAVREKRDSYQYDVVQPHFTFVFPTDKLDEAPLINHVIAKTKTSSPIPIALTSAKVVEDHSKEYFHTFLIPSTGNDQIIALHDRLYTDDLESELRSDIPFIPHLGIGSSKSKQEMEQLAGEISAKGINIEGEIDVLTIASYDGQKVSDLRQVPLR